jgi:hypothetical protein
MMTREEALSRIRMNPKMVPAGQDPEAFIAAMMAADAANSAPMTPPVEVSPADPAPVQAGIPIVAPPPMAPPMPPMATDFRNQAVLAANQTRPPGTDLISGNSGKDVVVPPAPAAPPAVAPPKLSLTPEEEAKLLQSGPDVVKKAREGAELPEDLKRYFDTIGQRTEAEIADVSKERKQQYWMALAMAGAKMAQSQSPYFATALAEGFESGLTGFNKARADASEKKARLQTRKEDLILKRYEVLQKVRTDAVNDLKAGYEITETQANIIGAKNKAIFDAATKPAQYEAIMAGAKKATAEATTAQATADRAPEIVGLGIQKDKAQIGLIGQQGRLISAQINKIGQEIAAAKNTGMPKQTLDFYERKKTSAGIKLGEALKLIEIDPEKGKILMADAMEEDRAADILMAPYAIGLTKGNPFIRTPENASLIPQGGYFRYPGVPGVFTNTRDAPSAQAVAKARGKTPASSPGVAPPGAVREKRAG